MPPAFYGSMTEHFKYHVKWINFLLNVKLLSYEAVFKCSQLDLIFKI